VSQYILRYEGFARSSGVCHVVVGRQGRDVAVLVGELEDNPGTSTINAIEQIAAAISNRLLDGRTDFSLYQFVLMPVPEAASDDELAPTFYRVTWMGGRPFSMPTWDVIMPYSDRWISFLAKTVRVDDYTLAGITADESRHLEMVDAVAEPLPWAS
jgi:hypothetical protein